jgi:mRNA-degrading endonuclease RelE of RelBE toxin-antitoxin system
MAIVELTPKAARQFDELQVKIRARVNRLRIRLTHWPDVSGAKRLSGKLSDCFRLRTGDYRLRFRVRGEKVIVDKIGHRKDFYDD